MIELWLIIVSAALVNNFVLVQFLGLCPFMGVSSRLDSAMGMSLATTFVLTLSSVVAYARKPVAHPARGHVAENVAFYCRDRCGGQFTELALKRPRRFCTPYSVFTFP